MPRDLCIELRSLRVSARIGVTDAELEAERPLRIEISIDSPANAATDSDAIADTIDYSAAAALAAELARSQPHRTLERLAARIAEALLERFAAAAVEVAVAKPDPPMDERADEVAVRLRATAAG